MKFKTLFVFIVLAIAAISGATGPWAFVAIHANNPHYTINGGDGSHASFYQSTAGTVTTIDVIEHIVAGDSNIDAVTGFLDSSSYVDFKWVLPYSYPLINLTAYINTKGIISGSGVSSTAPYGFYRAKGTVAGCVSGYYNGIWNAGGLTNNFDTYYNYGPTNYDGTYYHAYIPLPASSAYVYVNTYTGYTGTDDEDIDATLTYTVHDYN